MFGTWSTTYRLQWRQRITAAGPCTVCGGSSTWSGSAMLATWQMILPHRQRMVCISHPPIQAAATTRKGHARVDAHASGLKCLRADSRSDTSGASDYIHKPGLKNCRLGRLLPPKQSRWPGSQEFGAVRNVCSGGRGSQQPDPLGPEGPFQPGAWRASSLPGRQFSRSGIEYSPLRSPPLRVPSSQTLRRWGKGDTWDSGFVPPGEGNRMAASRSGCITPSVNLPMSIINEWSENSH
jgi:hypothetical protein